MLLSGLVTLLVYGAILLAAMAFLVPVLRPPIVWLSEAHCNWQCRRAMRRQAEAARQDALRTPARQ